MTKPRSRRSSPINYPFVGLTPALLRLAGISTARLAQFEGVHRRPPPNLDGKLRVVLELASIRREGDGEAG